MVQVVTTTPARSGVLFLEEEDELADLKMILDLATGEDLAEYEEEIAARAATRILEDWGVNNGE